MPEKVWQILSILLLYLRAVPQIIQSTFSIIASIFFSLTSGQIVGKRNFSYQKVLHPLGRYRTFYFLWKTCFLRLLPVWLKLSIFNVIKDNLINASIPQSSPLIGTKDHSSKINKIKRSIASIKRDQKIKDQVVSRINGSKFIRDQRSTRSKIKKINRRSSSFRSEIKSSKFNFSQIRSLIWS